MTINIDELTGTMDLRRRGSARKIINLSNLNPAEQKLERERAAARVRAAAWRKAHPGAQKALRRKWRQENLAAMKAHQRKLRDRNPARALAMKRKQMKRYRVRVKVRKIIAILSMRLEQLQRPRASASRSDSPRTSPASSGSADWRC